MKKHSHYQYSIAAVVHPKGDTSQLLLVKKRHEKKLNGGGRGWQLPAGKAHPGETIGQTAPREIKEETKIPRKKIRLHNSRKFGVLRAVLFNTAKRRIIVVVEATLKTKRPPRPNDEIKDSRYFSMAAKSLGRHWSNHVRNPLVRDRLNAVILSLVSGRPQLLEFSYANGTQGHPTIPYRAKPPRPLTRAWLRQHGVEGFMGFPAR